MKSSHKQPWYNHQYRSQEATRALNRREQRRLDNALGGSGSLATEYKFNLDRVNHEQKIIEKELERIRQGASNKHIGNASSSLPITKHVHPLQYGDVHAPSHSLRSPRPRLTDNNKMPRNDSAVNTTMLIEYLANVNKAPESSRDKIHTSILLNSNRQSESIPVQIKPAITSDQVELNEAENLTISSDRVRSKHSFDITQTNKSTSSGSPTDPNKSSVALKQNSQSLNLSTADSEMTSTKSGNRRKSRDAGYIPSIQEPGSEKRRVSTSGETRTEVLPNDKVVPAAQTTSKADNSESRTQEQKRINRVHAMEDLMKKPIENPDMFNPDGSLKTMYQLPAFDKCYEEAKKARYIRTREPLERDRQLTPHEIFDKK